MSLRVLIAWFAEISNEQKEVSISPFVLLAFIYCSSSGLICLDGSK